MLAFVRRLLSGTVARSTRAPRRPAYRPKLEVLEDRTLLSVLAEFHVNQTTLDNQFGSDNASDRIGRTVIVWTEKLDTELDRDIVWRTFPPPTTPSGDLPLNEIRLTDSANFNDFDPAVSVSRQSGDATIVWTRFNPANSSLDIMGQHFNLATGAAKSTQFVIAGTASDEFDPDVSISPFNGDFVVSFTVARTSTAPTPTTPNVLAKRYVALTTVPVQALNVGILTLDERESSVAVSQAGTFAIVYEEGPVTTPANNNFDNIRLKRFNSNGVLLNSVFVAVSSLDEENPSVAADNLGNFVVAWQQRPNLLGTADYNIRARKFQFNSILGPTLIVTATTTVREENPAVAVDPVSGNFVVAYQSQSPTQTKKHVLVTEFLANGTRRLTFDCGVDDFSRSNPAVSFGNGFYTVSYDKLADPTDELLGIFARRGQITV